MWSSMWYTSVLAILVADIRTGALQNKEIEPRRCNQCLHVNSTSDCTQHNVSVLCTEQQPHCGTVAVGPGFVSILKCLPIMDTSCSMKLESNSTYEISCVCAEHLCNAPFSKVVQNQLVQFAQNEILVNSSNMISDLFKFLKLNNETDVYKILTDEEQEPKIATIPISPTISTTIGVTKEEIENKNISNIIDVPHAEPLKHEATVPPDDDEDESEGSGSYDESRSQKRPASAPAAPSSYLPAEENKASSMFKNLLAIILITIYIIL